MFGKFVAVAALCLGATLAQGAQQNPARRLLIDACGQMRDNAGRIWSDQRIVSIRVDYGGNVVYCYVTGADRKMKSTFGVAPPRAGMSDLREPGREALLTACTQMRKDSDNVFSGRRVFFVEDPDIKVVYCLVAKPTSHVPDSLTRRGRSYFVYTSELLFMSYYGEPLDEGV
jgi:hypothetical protein